MAQRTIARMFDSYDAAAQAVSDLETAGIPHSDVSLVSNDARHRDATAAGANAGGSTGTGAGAGASVGTLIGGGAGLLAGIGSLAIPGVGPVVAAGWLIATLTGAGIGAAAGGLIGSLTGAGVSEEEANVYGEGVRRGGTLVTVRADESLAPRIEGILSQRGAVDWQARGAEYRQGGWSRFDETAAASSAATGTDVGTGLGTTAAGTVGGVGTGRAGTPEDTVPTVPPVGPRG